MVYTESIDEHGSAGKEMKGRPKKRWLDNTRDDTNE